MRIDVKIFIIVLISINFSCKKNANRSENHIIDVIVSTEKAKKEIGLKEIVDSVNFIKLYTDSLFLIGDIRNIVLSDKLFVQNFNKILIYNLDGSPYNKIDFRGKAQGEYYEINDFYVNAINKTIEIWDKVSRALLIYNYDGEFIKEQSFEIDADYFKKVGGYYYFFSSGTYLKKGEDAYKIFCLNEKGEIENSYLKSEYINLYSFSTPAFLNTFNNSLFFEDAPLGKIYRISNSRCELYCNIIIDGNTLLLEEFAALSNLRSAERYRKLNEDFKYSIGHTFLCDEGLTIEIRANNKWYFCFYNLENNQYLLGQELIEEQYFKLDVWGRFINKNYFIGYFPSYKIINSVNETLLYKRNPELYKLLKFRNKIIC